MEMILGIPARDMWTIIKLLSLTIRLRLRYVVRFFLKRSPGVHILQPATLTSSEKVNILNRSKL